MAEEFAQDEWYHAMADAEKGSTPAAGLTPVYCLGGETIKQVAKHGELITDHVAFVAADDLMHKCPYEALEEAVRRLGQVVLDRDRIADDLYRKQAEYEELLNHNLKMVSELSGACRKQIDEVERLRAVLENIYTETTDPVVMHLVRESREISDGR